MKHATDVIKLGPTTARFTGTRSVEVVILYSDGTRMRVYTDNEDADRMVDQFEKDGEV